MNTEQLRAEFEAWIASPPYEKPIGINPGASGFPGQYRAYEMQLAWEAYQAGRAALQSHDREDMDQWLDQLRILITEFGIACADSGAVEMHMMPKIFDHARRIEGGGK